MKPEPIKLTITYQGRTVSTDTEGLKELRDKLKKKRPRKGGKRA